MKKTLAILLSLLVIFSMTIPASSITTSDEDQRRYNEMRANEQYQVLLENLSEQTMSQNARNSSVDYYGGAYLNDDGNLVVCVTNDYDFKSNMIQSHTGEDIILEVVDYAYSELVNEQNEINRLYEVLFKRFKGTGSKEESLLLSVCGTYIDDERNRLIVEIEDLCSENIEQFRRLISKESFIEFEEGNRVAWTSTELNPGCEIMTSSGGSLSAGYPVYFVDDNGDIVQGFITAGHAFSMGDLVYDGENAGTIIGRCIQSTCGGNIDAALIEITNPRYIISQTTKHKGINLYSHCYTFPVKDTVLYMDGERTKGSEGVVISNRASETIEGIAMTNLIKTSIESLPGDSGGVAYLPTGSIVGSMSASYLIAGPAGPECLYSYISYVEYVLNAFDCQIWPCDGEDCEIDDCICHNRFS